MISLGFRIIWQMWPGMFTCSLFWVVVFWSMNYSYGRTHDWTVLVSALGALMNAIVTIANKGYMPVLSKLGNPLSVWVPADSTHRFLFLCDRFAGFSIGDFFIFAGLGLALMRWIWGIL